MIDRVERAAAEAGRDPGDVTLVAVSKGRSVEQILELYRAGQRDFGENRAQELAAKAADCPSDIRWHFVGPLQTNKVRMVRPVAALLHSMDRLDLGRAWMKGPGRPPPALLQVNVGLEPQKGGVAPDEVEEAAAGLEAVGVRLRGVMAIPPVADDPEDVRPYFDQLRGIRDRLAAGHPDIAELSMGMSDDFEVAISAGATLIRVGRAIFED